MSSLDTIMIFAAGLGTRMQCLTKNTPKTLLKINNRPILHYVLDLVSSYNFKKIIINAHQFKNQIEAAISDYQENLPEVFISYEPELLETGGGLKNAIKNGYITLGKPVFTINSDIIMRPNCDIFGHMSSSWKEGMSMMMMLYPTEKALGYTGAGDFFVTESGKVYGLELDEKKPFMYSGLQLIDPRIVIDYPQNIFSLKNFYFEEQIMNNVYSVIGDGLWAHASCPEDLASIEKVVK